MLQPVFQGGLIVRRWCPPPRVVANQGEMIAQSPLIRGILRTRLPQEIELPREEGFHVRGHLLRGPWEVAEIAQRCEQNGHAMAVDIAAALRNEALLGGCEQKVFDQFVMRV